MLLLPHCGQKSTCQMSVFLNCINSCIVEFCSNSTIDVFGILQKKAFVVWNLKSTHPMIYDPLAFSPRRYPVLFVLADSLVSGCSAKFPSRADVFSMGTRSLLLYVWHSWFAHMGVVKSHAESINQFLLSQFDRGIRSQSKSTLFSLRSFAAGLALESF